MGYLLFRKWIREFYVLMLDEVIFIKLPLLVSFGANYVINSARKW